MKTFLRRFLPENIFLRRWYSAGNAFLAALFYGFPARHLLCIGTTGTDGKTTTTEMIAHILRSQKKKVLSISTVSTKCGEEDLPTDKRTTPSPWMLQKLLRKAQKEGVEFAVLEVSSHALSQKRVFGISFSVAVLTNITPEHLDYHGTLQAYAKAKKLLFIKKLQKKGVSVLNISDSFGRKWQQEFSSSGKTVLSYARNIQESSSALAIESFRFTPKGMFFTARSENGETIEAFLPLFGKFNGENALAAVQVARFFNIPFADAFASLANFAGVKGRMESIEAGQDFFALVDFAITPGALLSLLNSAREMTTGRVLLVFGSCGTHPDVSLRLDMGKTAAEKADVVIITDDEPYFEDPAQIRQHILEGTQRASSHKTGEVHNIADRRQAIEFACKQAKKGDVVLLAGMGHLSSRNIKGEEQEWNDGEVLRDILKKM